MLEQMERWRIRDHVKAGGRAKPTPDDENWQTWNKLGTTNAMLHVHPIFDVGHLPYCASFDYDSISLMPRRFLEDGEDDDAATVTAGDLETTPKSVAKEYMIPLNGQPLKLEDMVPETKFDILHSPAGGLVLIPVPRRDRDKRQAGIYRCLQSYAAMKAFEQEDDDRFFPPEYATGKVGDKTPTASSLFPLPPPQHHRILHSDIKGTPGSDIAHDLFIFRDNASRINAQAPIFTPQAMRFRRDMAYANSLQAPPFVFRPPPTTYFDPRDVFLRRPDEISPYEGYPLRSNSRFFTGLGSSPITYA